MINKILGILSEIKENPEILNSKSPDLNIISDIRLDSLQMITFVLRLEEEFDIEIDFDSFDLSHLESISRLADFLDQQKEQSSTW